MQDIFIFSDEEKEKIKFLRNLFNKIKRWDKKKFKISCYCKSLCLYIPNGYSDNTVNKYLLNNEQEIYRKAYWTFNPDIPKVEIKDNQILFLGRLYSFKLDTELQDIYKIDDDNLIIYSNKNLKLKNNLLEFYNKQAHIIFTERVKYYSEKLNIKIKKINIGVYKNKLGETAGKGDILLDERIILAPIPSIDSVINHELAHYFHLDHSPMFYKKLEEIYTTYYKDFIWFNLYMPCNYPPKDIIEV